jgi:hypothetical protein
LALSFFERSRVLYIKDYTYVPVIEKVTQGSLEVIFSNHNLENLLVEHEKRIIEIIESANSQLLCHYLSLYNHYKSPTAKRILSELLNNAVAKLNFLDRVDVASLFQNALDHNFYHFSQYKRLAEKIIELFKGKIDYWSIDSHLEVIKFIISQPNLNPKDYYNDIVAYA